MTHKNYLNNLKNKILSEEAKVGIIGLGFIGLSFVSAIGEYNFPIYGYDRSVSRIQNLKKEISYINLPFHNVFKLIRENQFIPSSEPEILKNADIILICVCSSLDKNRIPAPSTMQLAFQTVFQHLKKGQLIVLQSSTYPGMTEDEFLPILLKSNFKVGEDFFLGYAPEITNFGDAKYTFNNIPRIISGVTQSCLEAMKLFYRKISQNIEICSSPRIAEAAKLLQNTYRLVNISLINELKIMFDRMDIDVWEVIKAASKKPFGFTPFYPSSGIGGDCIPVDPLYLAWKARVTGGPTTLIRTAEEVNETIPYYVVEKTIQGLNKQNKAISGSKILVLGVGYKKDLNDIRQSPGIKILSILKKFQAIIYYHDPHVAEINDHINFPTLTLKSEIFDYEKLPLFDSVIIATDHTFYDWFKVIDRSKLIIDCFNVSDSIVADKNKIIKA